MPKNDEGYVKWLNACKNDWWYWTFAKKLKKWERKK